jgi:hypothetical protein
VPKRIYLQPIDLVKKSRHHTAYVGDGAIHENASGGPLYKLEFVNGVAENVAESLYQRMKEAGIAGEKRPSRPDEEG